MLFTAKESEQISFRLQWIAAVKLVKEGARKNGIDLSKIKTVKKRKSYSNVAYMEVTKDEYSLPMAIADNGEELAEIRGVNQNVIYHYLSTYKGDEPKYIKIEMDCEDEEE